MAEYIRAPTRDILSPYRPLGELRSKILKEQGKEKFDTLNELVKLWHKTTSGILHQALDDRDKPEDCPIVTIPSGYQDLTFLLAWWCDVGKFTIDPTAVTNCLVLAKEAALFVRKGDIDNARDCFNRTFDAIGLAWPVLNRIVYATTHGVDWPKPIEPITKRGRPKGSKGERRLGIEKELRGGSHRNMVADMFGASVDYVDKIRREMDADTGAADAEKPTENTP